MGVIERLGEPHLHFWLTRSVAKTLGLSLSEALDQGRLSTGDYATLVTRCRRCNQVGACQNWLATNGAGADTPPEHCTLGDVFTRLMG